MTPGELVTALHTAGCRLIPEGEHLRVQDPQHALTDDLRQAIRQHKAALLALLAQPAPANDAAATVPSTPGECAPIRSTFPLPRHRTPAVRWARLFVQATRSGSTGGMTRPHGLTPP